jgi:NAD(P)-dependent dehydrogenase (short-subunit alcohol dehydrogenase family)
VKLAGAVALVTGANRGLGQHFVEALLERDAAKVFACARNIQTLAELGKRFGPRVVALRLDVTNDEAVAGAAAEALDLTLLVNNAGVLAGRGLIEAGELESLEREMNVNVYGLARMCLAFAPILSANAGGAILNVLSAAAMVNLPFFGTYSATKAAARSLTQCLRYELSRCGTQVFALYAGLIDTGMIDYVRAEKADPHDIVRAALDGMEANTLEIDADDRAKSIRERLMREPQALEESMHERARLFRADHPL